MYAFYQRTYAMDVRDATTYVFLWRTYSEMQIRDYASADGDSGLRFCRWRFGTTLLEIEISGQRWIPNTQNTGFRGSGWKRSPWTHFSGLSI